MAVESRYRHQMAFVGTETQRDKIREEADRKKVSAAAILRAAIDLRYGLVDGEVPGEQPEAAPGATFIQPRA